MTMDIGHGNMPRLHALPDNVPPDTTIGLLQAILHTLQVQNEQALAGNPSLTQFDLSPDAVNTPNGRLLYGASRIRMESLTIVAVGAVTLTLFRGETQSIAFPAVPAGTLNTISVPIAVVLERGSSLQLRATAATWTAWVLGTTE